MLRLQMMRWEEKERSLSLVGFGGWEGKQGLHWLNFALVAARQKLVKSGMVAEDGTEQVAAAAK
jgi:hypothetical protein